MTKDPQTTQSEPAPPGSGLVKFLAWLIGPAGLVIVAPWFMPILGLGLFPDYFDPLPKVGADLAFFVSFLVGMGWYRRVKYEDMKWSISRIWIPLLVGCFVGTLAFRLTISVVWEPNASIEWVVLILWFLAFVGIFATLGLNLLLGGYMFLGNELSRKASRVSS
jgi:hypothetical protein